MTDLVRTSLGLHCVAVVLCAVALLGFEGTAHAEPPPGPRVSRLALSVAAPDAVMFAVVGGVLFADAAGRDSRSERNTSLGLASAYTALFGMNLSWIVLAGTELSARLDGIEDRMSLKTARIGTAFSSVDTAARTAALATGIALFTNPGEGLGGAGATGIGIALVVTNGVLLPFHIWGLVVHVKELRWRKRGSDPQKAHKLSPIPGGFRF